MNCLNKCEFQEFNNGYFKCNYYNKDLLTEQVNIGGDEYRISVLRCKECVNEGFIGSNSLEESLNKIKQRLGFTADAFYSFKDDFETELGEIYRIIKHLEKKANAKDEKIKLIGD